MFSFIANMFGYILEWLYNLVGQNFGIAIILFTLLLRLLLLPITIKQQTSMKKSAEIQGKVKEIQFKYKNNPEQMNKEVMELYKREKMSPFSGCLGTILQVIIILSVFWLVSRPLTYMKKIDTNIIDGYKNEITEQDGKISNYYEIEIIQKKAEVDENVRVNMNFLGLDLSKVPSQNLKDFTVYIIPVLYVDYINELFCFYVVNSLFELCAGFESRNAVFRNVYRFFGTDVTSYLGSTFFEDEATETAEIYVLTLGQAVLQLIDKTLYDHGDRTFVIAGTDGYFVN